MKIKVNPAMMEEAMFIGSERGQVFGYKGCPGQLPQDVADGWGAECIGYEFIPVALKEMTTIPAGHDLIVKEAGTDLMYTLYGFDEIGQFADIKNPVYGFGPIMGNGNLDLFEFTESHEMFKVWLDNIKLPDGPIPVK